jgi:hypothetical protein
MVIRIRMIYIFIFPIERTGLLTTMYFSHMHTYKKIFGRSWPEFCTLPEPPAKDPSHLDHEIHANHHGIQHVLAMAWKNTWKIKYLEYVFIQCIYIDTLELEPKWYAAFRLCKKQHAAFFFFSYASARIIIYCVLFPCTLCWKTHHPKWLWKLCALEGPFGGYLKM